MSDQYTRISSGGSPLDKNAPTQGLLFGLSCSGGNGSSATTTNRNDPVASKVDFLQVLDADDIPVEVSDTSTLQVDLHTAVFPKHKVIGWYRVSVNDEEPTTEDLSITKSLKVHYATSDPFCFCLLKVQKTQDNSAGAIGDDEMKMEDTSATVPDTLSKDLPINLYELRKIENTTILVGLSNWQLETSVSERIAVERVMRERPSEIGDGSPSNNPYVLETKAIQHSLTSMNDRVQFLASYLENIQAGKVELSPSLLRQIHQLVFSLGPLSSLAATSIEGEEEDVTMLAHLAIVARTVNTIQSYTEKFRAMNENRTLSKEMRRPF